MVATVFGPLHIILPIIGIQRIGRRTVIRNTAVRWNIAASPIVCQACQYGFQFIFQLRIIAGLFIESLGQLLYIHLLRSYRLGF